jgi:hypothetical protein
LSWAAEDVGFIPPWTIRRIFFQGMGELADKFTACCRGIPGAEDIDALSLTPEQKKRYPSRADFFFRDRTIVCEVKVIEADTAKKFIDYLESQGVHFESDTYYEDLIGYIKDRENGEAVWLKAKALAMTPIEQGIAEANAQIRATRELYRIESSDGLLIFVNGAADIFGPQLVIDRIFDRLMKPNTVDDGPYYNQIRQILLLSENYILDNDEMNMHAAIPIANGPIPEKHGVYSFLPTIVEAWATCNGRTFDIVDIPALHS